MNQRLAAAGATGFGTEPGEVDRAALRMEIEQALRELRHLGDAARDGDARYGVAPEVFQHAADEVAHVDQRRIAEAVERLDRGLGGRSRRAGHVIEPERPGDIDAAMDRVDPGRAGIGYDDAGRPENRETADDPEAPVERPFREFLPTRDGDLDLGVGRDTERRRRLADGGPDHGAGDRVDGRLAGRDREARPRHSADAFARAEQHSHAGGRRPYGHDHKGAMGHVRVVARVLDDARAREACAAFGERQREGRPLSARQRDGHRIGECARMQRLERGPRRRRRAGTCGPAAAQRVCLGGVAHRAMMYGSASAIHTSLRTP